MCVTREQLFYDDLYSYNRFRPSRLGAGLAAMLPGLASIDVTDLDGFAAAMRAALDVDGPAVVSVECAADEIPPFAPFLVQLSKTTAREEIPTVKKERTMSLPALDDIRAHHSAQTGTDEPIDGLTRIETSPREKATLSSWT